MTAWEKIEQRRLVFVNRYSRVFRKVLNKQIQPLLDSIDSSFITNYEQVINTTITDAEILEPYVNLYQDVGISFRDSLMISMEKSGAKGYRTKSLEDDVWAQAMADYAEMVTLGRVEMMTDTTRNIILKMVRDSINDNIDSTLGVESFATKIRNSLIDKYGVVEKWRARRIAQTEVLTASNYSSFKAAEETGIPMKKRWLTAPFGVAKNERHNLAFGLTEQRPAIKDPFYVDGTTMQHPGDLAGGAHNTINCRCAIGYEQY